MEDKIIDFPQEIPEELMQRGYSLKDLGLNDLAWESTIAIEIIKRLVECGYAVLGGDVYDFKQGVIESTYDSWYTNRTLEPMFLKISGEKAIEYISKYIEKNGENYFFSLVFDKE